MAQQLMASLPGSSKVSASRQEFVALSSAGEPRWFVPAGRDWADDVLANWSPYRLSSRLKWAAIRAASRAGLLSNLAGARATAVAGLDEIDWSSLGWKHRSHPVPLVYVGTPGATRKAVVHLIEPSSGECRAVLKLPLTEAAKAAIVREADVLARLTEEHYARAPRLLFVDPDRGVATQTFLPGRSGGRGFNTIHRELLNSLMLPGECTTLANALVDLTPSLSLAAETDRAVIDRLLPRLANTTPLPACWVHGDFAPWNLREAGHGETALLDWEDARRGGLPLQDAFHFLHIQDYLFGKPPQTHSHFVAPMAASLGVKNRLCFRLEAAYLLTAYLLKNAQQDQKHANFLLGSLRLISKLDVNRA